MAASIDAIVDGTVTWERDISNPLLTPLINHNQIQNLKYKTRIKPKTTVKPIIHTTNQHI